MKSFFKSILKVNQSSLLNQNKFLFSTAFNTSSLANNKADSTNHTINLINTSKFSISKFSRELLLKKREEKLKKKNQINDITDNEQDGEILKNILASKPKEITYSPVEALKIMREKEISGKNTNEHRVLLATNINYIKGGNIVRGTRPTPGGAIKTPKICVFTSPSFQKIALDAGADMLADQQTFEDILNKKIEFDMAIATMDVMNQVKVLGRILGPLNMMPSPKVGTAVTVERLEDSIKEFKQGVTEFRANNNIIHIALGKYSFSDINLLKNLDSFVRELDSKRPDSFKVFEAFVKNSYLSCTGTKGSIKINLETIDPHNIKYFGNITEIKQKKTSA